MHAVCDFCYVSVKQLAVTDLEQESRRRKVLDSLGQVIQTALEVGDFAGDSVSVFKNLRKKFQGETWAQPLIRKILHDYWAFHNSHRCNALMLQSLLNYIKNTPLVYSNKNAYPLHEAVFSRKLYRIRQLCIGEDPACFFTDVDAPDPLGNTPLMLAVKLAFFQEALVLIDHGADPKYRFQNAPCPIEQALAMKEMSILRVLVIGYHKNLQLNWQTHAASLSNALEEMPDFSLKLKWGCSSNFIPFVKKFTPSDCYSIWKKGKNVKVDLTLVGWEKLKAKRGNMSLLFLGENSKLMLVDHETKTVNDLVGELSHQQLDKYTQSIMRDKKFSGDIHLENLEITPASNWRRQEVWEQIGDWSAQKHTLKFHASMSMEKRRVTQESELANITNFEQYFEYALTASKKYDVLSPPVKKRADKKVKASVWTSKDFPISLQQFMPLVELMSKLSKKVNRLKEFFKATSLLENMHFPVRIKTPLMLSVKAIATFEDFKMEEIPDDIFVLDYLPVQIQSALSEDGDFPQTCLTEEEENMAMPSLCEESDEEVRMNGPVFVSEGVPKPVFNDSDVEWSDEEETHQRCQRAVELTYNQKRKISATISHFNLVKRVKEYLRSSPKHSIDADIEFL